MITSKYICIRDLFEDEDDLSSSGDCYCDKCYNIETVDLSGIGRKNIYRIYDDNGYIKTIYDTNTLKDHFMEYGIWKALCRDKQIESILQD